jgi:hypothetical protein
VRPSFDVERQLKIGEKKGNDITRRSSETSGRVRNFANKGGIVHLSSILLFLGQSVYNKANGFIFI